MLKTGWEQAWLNSRPNPLLFVTDVLGVQPRPWQEEALKRFAVEDRLAIRSGHGIGKTAFISWCILWFLLTHSPCKIPVTANSGDQLADVVWPELAHWYRKLPEALQSQLELQTQRLSLKAEPEEGFAVARTGSRERPEALQGFQSPNLLFVIEEASGIHESVFEVAQGALASRGAKVLMPGNPTRTAGFFYDAFHKLRSRWSLMHVSSLDVPAATGHVDDIIARYGNDSNVYRVRVLGDFPTSEDDVVIPLGLVEAALDRDVVPLAVKPVWGVDVARYGDDRSALAKRQGNRLLETVQSWRNKDTMQTAGLVFEQYVECNDASRPVEILVDVIGMGAGVVDRLKELGAPVRGINVAEAPSVKERYRRLRDELWFAAREWFEARDVSMPDDAGLISELTSVKYDVPGSQGKLVVESKDLMKRRLPEMGSPDLADAFILTFASGLARIEQPRDRYSKSKRLGSAWSA
jgi:phage terminase large subunit